MGCGTGPLAAAQTFEAVIRFSEPISADHPVYTHFKDAVEFLLPGQIQMTPSRVVDGLIEEVTVAVVGPLSEAEAPAFNRAFNRVMWGLQRRRPGDRNSNYAVRIMGRKLDNVPQNDDPWRDEWT